MPQGYFYGPLRSAEHIAVPADARVVLVLRDPRDVLTSRYYSVAYSHSPKDDKFLRDRERAQRQGIDAFVRERLPEVLDQYRIYVDRQGDFPNRLSLRYEEMVEDFAAWLNRLAHHVSSNPDPGLIAQLIEESDFATDKEDAYAHRRSVRPGNYLEKLQPETIAVVETAFGDILTRMGYAHTVPALLASRADGNA